MNDSNAAPPAHSLKKEPKFCRCRACHEHFYADTIAQAQADCRAHARDAHPEWGEAACYCPD